VNIFYVYEHWRLDKNICFYVGKGKGKRAFDMLHRGPHHRSVTAKLAVDGIEVDVRFVGENLDEDAAFDLEVERIAFWRARGTCLTNKTDGGEGPAGYVQTPEHRRKKTEAVKAHRQTPAGRALLARMTEAATLANTGRPLSEETKSKMSKTRKAMPITPQQLAFGERSRNKTPEHIAAIVAAKAAARVRRLSV
jgi:NUMOD3 motif